MKLSLCLIVFLQSFIVTTILIQYFKPFDKIVSSIDLCQYRHTTTKTDSSPLYGRAKASHSEGNGTGAGGTPTAMLSPSMFGGFK